MPRRPGEPGLPFSRPAGAAAGTASGRGDRAVRAGGTGGGAGRRGGRRARRTSMSSTAPRGSAAGGFEPAAEGVNRGSSGCFGGSGWGVADRLEAWRSSASGASGSSERRHGRRSPSPSRREKWTLSDPPLSAPQAARGGQPRGRRQAGTGLGGRSGSTHSQTAFGLGSRVHGKARQTKSLTPTHALPSLSRGPFHFLYPTQGQPRANPGPTQ